MRLLIAVSFLAMMSLSPAAFAAKNCGNYCNKHCSHAANKSVCSSKCMASCEAK